MPLLASPTPLPTPVVRVTSAPEAEPVLTAFLQALTRDDYASMYALLSSTAQQAIGPEEFAIRYREVLNNLSAYEVQFEVGQAALSPATAQVPFRITYRTSLVGDISREMVATLVREQGQWRIEWNEGLILPELAGGNRLARDCQAPPRGNIYDRSGQPLVSTTEAIALGIDTANVNLDRLFELTQELARLTGIDAQQLANRVLASGPGWYIPVGTTSREEGVRLLGRFSGLVTSPYTSRYYHNSGIASQTIGYTLSISPETLDYYKRRGYCGDERVGWTGIERARESVLAGQHGGTIYVINPQGQVVTTLGQKESQPAGDVYLTLDKNLQFYAQQALAGFSGAVVVLERDSGRVLAMASTPGFDPNLFDPLNRNQVELLPQLFNDPRRPMYNRATQGQYPLGSVFKIITFAAALESGLYLPETQYDCQYQFTELPDRILYDWTWERCQQRLKAGEECNTSSSRPSGLLTLQEGLMRSCNPYFWHIGLDLYRNQRGGDIARMARAFGLGSRTGLEVVEEEPGQILEPQSELEATNQAIGQGDVLVTPLQVARFVAAVGNGGLLYRPQLIEKVVDADGQVLESFTPEITGALPIRPDRLQALQEAMRMVIQSPRGTANFRIGSMPFPAAGKTGTAESNIPGSPHAWFAGYTYGNYRDKPDIAVAVVVEYAGEGSDYAAPVFRRILEVYYFGQPQALYWFESSFGVTRTPTPLGGIPTPTPR